LPLGGPLLRLAATTTTTTTISSSRESTAKAGTLSALLLLVLLVLLLLSARLLRLHLRRAGGARWDPVHTASARRALHPDRRRMQQLHKREAAGSRHAQRALPSKRRTAGLTLRVRERRCHEQSHHQPRTGTLVLVSMRLVPFRCERGGVVPENGAAGAPALTSWE
jgi:hypothetical protein